MMPPPIGRYPKTQISLRRHPPFPHRTYWGTPPNLWLSPKVWHCKEHSNAIGDFPQGRLRELSQNRPLGFTKVGQKDSPNIIWRIPQYGIMGYFRKACRDFPKPAKRFLYIRHSPHYQADNSSKLNTEYLILKNGRRKFHMLQIYEGDRNKILLSQEPHTRDFEKPIGVTYFP